MVKWKKLRNAIPSQIQIKKGVVYEVAWIKEFPSDSEIMGETRLSDKLILINTNQSDKEAVHTFFHEVLHAFSDENGAKLTEKQVQKMEKSLYFLIKLMKAFT